MIRKYEKSCVSRKPELEKARRCQHSPPPLNTVVCTTVYFWLEGDSSQLLTADPQCLGVLTVMSMLQCYTIKCQVICLIENINSIICRVCIGGRSELIAMRRTITNARQSIIKCRMKTLSIICNHESNNQFC